jgi:hypothetical protein
MSLVRFFFGHSWWTLLYVLTYAWLALTVVFILLMFGQDLKHAGQAPDLPSPGSILVVMICCGLAVMTACFVGIGIGIRAGAGWGVVAALALGTVVLIADGYLNIWLAEQQSVRAFYVNLVVAVLVVLANLTVMHLAINRPSVEPSPLPGPPPLTVPA